MRNKLFNISYFKIVNLILLSLVCSISISKANNSDILSLSKEVNECYYSFDVSKIKSVLNQSDKLIKIHPNDYYAYYYNGILRYCLGRVVYNTDSDLAYEYFDSSLDMFEKAWELKQDAVSLAMISAAYGKKSALSPLRAIFFGGKAKNRIYDAFHLDSNNSKVLLVAATHLMHVPGIYGGDKKKARNMLNKCLEINKKRQFGSDFELEWADDAEIYAYLAQLDILEKKYESAVIQMKKSLELRPDYGFVKIDLENQLKKARK